RKTDQSDVGEQLESQRQPSPLTRQATFGEARRLVCRPSEALVAASPGAAAGDYRTLTGTDQIVEGRVALDHYLRARRDPDLEHLPVRAVPQRSLTVAGAS